MSKKEAKVAIKGFGDLPDRYGKWTMHKRCLNDARTMLEWCWANFNFIQLNLATVLNNYRNDAQMMIEWC